MIYDRFYYTKLNNDEKVIYKQIYEGLDKLNKKICLNISCSLTKSIEQIIMFVNLDNPHLFYVDFTIIRHRQGLFGLEIIPSYLYTKKEVSSIKNKINLVVNKILSKVNGKTEYEKELSLHDVLISNIVYDDLGVKNPRANSPKNNTIIGPLFFKSAVCEGIAKAYKFLLNLLDIKCIVASGIELKTNDNHAWNIVKIENKPYYVDVTWDLDSYSKGVIIHDYFNLTTNDLAKDHEINNLLPICVNKEYNYFVKENLVAKTKDDVDRIVLKAITNKENCVEFKFVGNTSLENVINYAISKLNMRKTTYLKNEEFGIIQIVLPCNNNAIKNNSIGNNNVAISQSKSAKSFFSKIIKKIIDFFSNIIHRN